MDWMDRGMGPIDRGMVSRLFILTFWKPIVIIFGSGMALSVPRVYFLHPNPQRRASSMDMQLNLFIPCKGVSLSTTLSLHPLIRQFRHALSGMMNDKAHEVNGRFHHW
jgi:hypothetical protein